MKCYHDKKYIHYERNDSNMFPNVESWPRGIPYVQQIKNIERTYNELSLQEKEEIIMKQPCTCPKNYCFESLNLKKEGLMK